MYATLRYVGDPFVSAGVAVVQCLSHKEPEQLDVSELESQAQELEQRYRRAIWQRYLTIHFPNSGWCNPTIGPQKKEAFLDSVLRGYNRPALPNTICSYCARPAQDIADRSKIPLLSGATIMSSGPAGIPGVPVCGFCLFATQFYPLATLKVGGRPLFWWCADPLWLVRLTAQFFDEVRSFTAGTSDVMPNLSWRSTRLLATAEAALSEWLENGGSPSELPDFIGCHATNYGSQPNYDEIHIRRSLLDFIAWGAGKRAYRALIARHRQEPKKTKKTVPNDGERFWRNSFYEDLGAALVSPDYIGDMKKIAARFMREIPPAETQAGTFELWSEFLHRVAGMDKERITVIIEIADQIASSSEHVKIVKRMQRGYRFSDRIGGLVYAQRKICEANEPSISTEKLLRALDLAHLDDETGRDVWLVFDLMLIRIYEKLPQAERQEILGELSQSDEDVPELTEKSEV